MTNYKELRAALLDLVDAKIAMEADETNTFNRDQAAAAASKLFDYADHNVTMFDACCGEVPQRANDIYSAAKALHDLLSVQS